MYNSTLKEVGYGISIEIGLKKLTIINSATRNIVRGKTDLANISKIYGIKQAYHEVMYSIYQRLPTVKKDINGEL